MLGRQTDRGGGRGLPGSRRGGRRFVPLLAGACLLAGVCQLAAVSFAQEGPDPTHPTSRGVGVPITLLTRLGQLLHPPVDEADTTQPSQQTLSERLERLQRAVDFGYEIVEKFPDADNLLAVRHDMLQAAISLNDAQTREVHRQQLITICRDILAADAPPRQKLPADVVLADLAVQDAKTPAQRSDALRGLVDGYANTDVAAGALVNAAALAYRAKMAELGNDFINTLAERFSDDGEVVRFLARLGRRLPFKADLTTLDGQAISLPDDLLGKVVIVDFWATWCPQSRRSMSHLRRLYAAHKAAGLEIVGISLDKPDQADAVRAYVAENQLAWIQTYSGRHVDDPTFSHYGLDATPSIWIIDRQGFIVTDNALRDLGNPDAPMSLDNIDRNVQQVLQRSETTASDD
ncbi:hypothetical protein LCGC14_0340010 [marine sediment metagenome]|uniref:Thioredoxin domain-containing protein n=1 Tax=marine sediment metagenome TaxID=412755 RepID=A0A0F9TJJ6_9ZZZZ